MSQFSIAWPRLRLFKTQLGLPSAFSVATVIATRYHHHRWVPWLAYGLATAMSLLRVSTLSHFPSSVFLGAALGYFITREQTLRPE